MAPGAGAESLKKDPLKPKPRSSAIWVAKSELSKEMSKPEELQKAPQPDIGSAAEPDSDSKPQTLIRQVSLSKLNAEAPVFVPKAPSPSPSPSPTLIPAMNSSSALNVQPGQPGVLTLPHHSEPDPDEQILSTSAPKSTSSSSSSTSLSDELRAQVVQQVEFYFSDANLPTDHYMMKFIRKDPEGFVPLPVIASFRKVKQLSKNYNALAAALRTSSKLVVSEDGKKIRRVEPLAEVDLDEIQARTVVAENLPDDHSIQNLEKLFGSVGTVKMVRVCEPGSANSVNNAALKNLKVDRVISNKLHALVEYETLEQAEKAVAELTDQRNWRSGLHVRLLLRRMYPTKHNNHTHVSKGRKSVSDQPEAFGEEESGEKSNESEAPSDPADEQAPGGDGEKESGSKRAVVIGRGRGRGRGNRGRSGMNNGPNGGMLGSSPQISFSPSLSELVMAKPPPGPRMPDGTRGFTFGRGKDSSRSSLAAAAASS